MPRPPFPYKKILSAALQILVVGLLVWYFVQNRGVFGALRNVTWQAVLAIAAIELASFAINSYLNYSMIRRLDRRVTYLDCFLLQYVNNLLNKILPTIGGGAAFRAVFLKQKYQFPYAQFASTVAGLYVVSFFSTALIALICLLVIYARLQVFNWIIFLAFAGIFLVTLAIILFSPDIPPGRSRVTRVLHSIIQGWNILKKDPRSIPVYTVLSVALLLLVALENWIIYRALAGEPDMVGMIYLATLGIIMAFLNFTPDGIGVKEGIYIFTNDLVQISDSILVLGSLILRGISMLTTVAIAGVSYWLLLRQMKQLGGEQKLS